MNSSHFLRLAILGSLSVLLLGGCGSGPTMTSTPPSSPTSYQLRVTTPASGAGTISSNPAGITCPGTCTAAYDKGTKVSLTVTTESNYFFEGWSGACTGTAVCSVTMTAAETVTPVFKPGYDLTVAVTGNGVVTSTPPGINCPSSACSASFPQGTAVTLTEAPGSGYSFGDWGGSCSGISACNVTVNASGNVTANFVSSTSVILSVSVSGAGHGAVTSNPGGINCSSGTCSANFSPGAQVTLTGTPGANYSFSGWTGCSGGFSCSFILSSAETITAKFGSSNPYAALNHIILFAQENRSFDHYFGYMRQYWANHGIPDQPFDGLPQFTPAAQCTFNNGINSCAAPSIPGCNLADDMEECKPDGTNPIASFHLASVCQENQSPFWNEAHNDWDFADPTGSSPADLQNPALDGFVWTAAYDARSNNFMDLNGVRAMGYFNDTDLNYYYFMATQFGTSDRWFSPVMSRTELNRMYMIAATSQGYAYPISSNPQDATVLSAKTIFEALQAAGISWRIYVDTVGTSCGGMTQPQLGGCLATYNSYINMFQYGATVASNPSLAVNVVPVTQFASDAASNSLPQFALIEPASNAGLDEHPSDSDEYPSNVQLGAQYAAEQIINPLMQSVSWGDSALIFAYDEAGGFYDHVPPEPAAAPGNTSQDPAYPIDLESSLNDICTGPGQIGTGMCDFSWTGYRVPLIVISPYSLKNYVSHNVRDTTAVLKMVEQRFGLAPLTNRDAAQLDLTEFFDFVNKPWATPPTPPVQTVYPQTGTPPACSLAPAANWVEPPAS